MNQLQHELNARRRKLKLTYRDLEYLTGINRSTVWSLLNGPMRQPPKLEQIEKLAKGLDWPATYLQQMVGEQFGYHVYEDRSPELQVVVASWEELSERDRRTIARMVEELRRTTNDGG